MIGSEHMVREGGLRAPFTCLAKRMVLPFAGNIAPARFSCLRSELSPRISQARISCHHLQQCISRSILQHTAASYYVGNCVASPHSIRTAHPLPPPTKFQFPAPHSFFIRLFCADFPIRLPDPIARSMLPEALRPPRNFCTQGQRGFRRIREAPQRYKLTILFHQQF